MSTVSFLAWRITMVKVSWCWGTVVQIWFPKQYSAKFLYRWHQILPYAEGKGCLRSRRRLFCHCWFPNILWLSTVNINRTRNSNEHGFQWRIFVPNLECFWMFGGTVQTETQSISFEVSITTIVRMKRVNEPGVELWDYKLSMENVDPVNPM